jgi:hypothetical protein
MGSDTPDLCKLCGGVLRFIARISLPRQAIFQCEGCREYVSVSYRPDNSDKNQR